MPDWLNNVSIGQVAAVAAFLLAVGAGIRRVWPMLCRIKDLIDDLAGEPARPGVPARPGLMERMAATEEQVRKVMHQVHPNGGGSMRDAINRIETRVGQAATQIDEHVQSSEADRADLRELIETHIAESTADRAALHHAVDALSTETFEHHDDNGVPGT